MIRYFEAAAALLLKVILQTVLRADGIAGLAGKSISYLLPILLLVLVHRRCGIDSGSVWLRNPQKCEIVSTIFFCVMILSAISTVGTVLEMLFHMPSALAYTGDSLPVMLLSSLLAAPVLEEVFWRGYLLSLLADAMPDTKISKTAAILLCGILFGFFHGSPARMLYAGISGILLGILALRIGALPCIIVHMLNNLRVLLSLYTGHRMTYAIVFAAAGGIALLLLLYVKRRRISRDKREINRNSQ